MPYRREMIEGRLDRHIVVDALQGGAGTSTNMNVNEVLVVDRGLLTPDDFDALITPEHVTRLCSK